MNMIVSFPPSSAIVIVFAPAPSIVILSSFLPALIVSVPAPVESVSTLSVPIIFSFNAVPLMLLPSLIYIPVNRLPKSRLPSLPVKVTLIAAAPAVAIFLKVILSPVATGLSGSVKSHLSKITSFPFIVAVNVPAKVAFSNVLSVYETFNVSPSVRLTIFSPSPAVRTKLLVPAPPVIVSLPFLGVIVSLPS